MQWNKMVGDEGGYKTIPMGDCWTCCVDENKDAAGCASPATYSDLHAPCKQCGTLFYPFELPLTCRYHAGKLVWKEAGSKQKYRWTCCDRLSHEEGCREHFKHVVVGGSAFGV
jgi:hypothetical protein